MASVGGVSSSSSIYGNRNIITGLASGMDTESMIENAVSGIKARISSLGQKRTKVEWQQEGYRSIISKMASFNNKYTSYTSGTNLLSSTFFNNAVITTTKGENASKVSASGKTSSDIVLNGVRQLATAARRSSSAEKLFDPAAVSGGESFDLAASIDVSAISGNLNIAYGNNNSITLNFSDMEKFDSAKDFVDAINKKLADQTINFKSGTKTADEAIKVELDSSGNITFQDKTEGGNTIKISASGDMKKLVDDDVLATAGKNLKETKNTLDYLEGKTLTVRLDGVTKTIKLPGADDLKDVEGNGTSEKFINSIQKQLDEAFEGEKVKVTDADASGKIQLKFEAIDTKTDPQLKVSSSAGEALGLGSGGVANYLDTGMTLDSFKGLEPDDKGNYTLTVNGEEFSFSGDTALETVMMKVNSNTKAGVKLSYSSLTNKFVFTSKETGEEQKIELGGTLSKSTEDGGLFGTDVQSAAGKNAIFTVTVNGDTKELERSTNTVDLDGLKVTMNGEFGYKQKVDTNGNPVVDSDGNPEYEKDANGYILDPAEKVTFSTKADTDKLVNAIKGMVEDYNAMISEIKSAYSTMPAEKNTATHTRYEPLTDEDKADMSETAIANYEEKAKQGILFADSDLSSLYSKLRTAIAPSGDDGAFLRSIGISTEYNDGLTTLKLDESALRTALENNPDGVKDAFTKTKESGSATNGLMQNLKTQLDAYASTTGATKGILIEKAGSPLAPTSILKNSIKDQLDNIDKQILKWQNKMADQIDMYTTQFSRLEQLTAQMNSQSSMLMGMMMGGSQ